MTKEMKDTFERLEKEVLSYQSIDPDTIPNIDVYMDQLTTFMDRKLRAQTRDPSRDKVLTKTMINNYTKNDLLPPPVKKKYMRDHLILLIYIFYFKNNLTMSDINTLITPLKEQFGEEHQIALDDIYRETLKWCETNRPHVQKEMERMYQEAEKTFDKAPSSVRDKLQRFAFLAMLEYDVFMKQTMIERMLDAIIDEEEEDT